MLSTTGGYTIQETADGVALLQGKRVITRYKIIQLKNGNWRVRLYGGAPFGLTTGQFLSSTVTYGAIFNQCVIDLNSIVDELLSDNAGA